MLYYFNNKIRYNTYYITLKFVKVILLFFSQLTKIGKLSKKVLQVRTRQRKINLCRRSMTMEQLK